MMMSMYSAVSGLRSQQTKLNVIGNNVANINTLGYKGQSVGFSDLLSQTISSAGAASGTRGGTNAKQIGLGSQVSSISTNMSTGSSQYTGNDTDAALSGAGLFVVQGGGTGRYQFTRAGNFGVDVDGNLVVNGLKVCGWNDYSVDLDGNVTYSTQSEVTPLNAFGTATKTIATSAVDAAPSSGGLVMGTLSSTGAGSPSTQTITYYTETAGVISPATATATFTDDTANLTAAEKTAGAVNKWNWGVLGASPAAGSIYFDANGKIISSLSAVKSSITMGVGVTPASLSLDFSSLKISTATALTAFADGVPVAIPAGTKTVIVNKQLLAPEATTKATLTGNLDPNTAVGGTGTTTITAYDSLGSAHEVKVTFTKNSTGNWSWATSSNDPTFGVVGGGTITFNTDGTIATGGSGSIAALASNGSSAINVAVDFSSIGQYSTSTGASSVSVYSRDGYSSGTLQDFSIGTDGIVMGSYSNGQKQSLGEIGLAVFTNPQGLEKIGDNLYTTTVNSGDYSGAVEVGTGGAGGLTTGALEMSNVDLASEFSEMMITQRAYQANSKIITTSDSLLETLINMSR